MVGSLPMAVPLRCGAVQFEPSAPVAGCKLGAATSLISCAHTRHMHLAMLLSSTCLINMPVQQASRAPVGLAKQERGVLSLPALALSVCCATGKLQQRLNVLLCWRGTSLPSPESSVP